ncbi:MAG: hypothetical protein HETSPECPRED_008192 [Heterodermia speciosa]|uniref:Ribosomal protein/NADH dehydrogenase domain-containing protein n=1 Tax=Heterodermia speciosa TaxID=116794 RepID=A0A8H3FZD2_9LECA|nr:MAG: hypothetical protein HETSPECPRED_008192 [Heterodermia speciosa]
MVNIINRMRRLKTLLDIRLGPGAAILPPDVKRIHLSFAYKLNDGHFGARKVWRQYLPRLKYHNPAVSMTVDRSEDNTGPATLSIFFVTTTNTSSASAISSQASTSSTTASKATSDHTPFERVESIDMKHKHEEEILEQVMQITKAVKVDPSPDEELEMRQLEDQRTRSQRDAETTRLYNEKVGREKALLEQARTVVG